MMDYITDHELVNLRTKELNDLLKNMTKSEAKQIKIRRRLLKNRGYAQATRSKRLETKEQLEVRKAALKQEIEKMKKEEKPLLDELNELRRQNDSLEQRQSGSTSSGLPNYPVKIEDPS